jgi:phosphatidylinositol-3-phosphatase
VVRRRVVAVAGIVVLGTTGIWSGATASAATDGGRAPAAATPAVTRAAVERGDITHVVVIDLENESFSTTFGATSPATYLNSVLVPKGELVENYYATSHVSQGNYISQISGQAATPTQNNDCIDLSTLRKPPVLGGFTDITPGTPAADGQVVGDGCVFPASVPTIGSQLDARYAGESDVRLPWRAYVEDMGNNPARDYGTTDPSGGTDCAHPPIGGPDYSNSASVGDQYATRHNPFVYFHSIIDNTALCNSRVVPLGTLSVGTGGARDTFTGHLAADLREKETTPALSFVVPNLCNDGHDAKCVAPDIEGGSAGGLAAADLWLKHWMPLLLDSPAYRSGEMLIVVTFDEAGFGDTRACCGQQPGPNLSNPGYSPILGLFGLQTPPTSPGVYPGGGQVGAVLLNAKLIKAGTRNTTGYYNHYSALRSYEDILDLRAGGTDGYGHLGLAATATLRPFGTDVFTAHH